MLIINKTDLAPYVRVNLDVMARDAACMRQERPVIFTDLFAGKGVAELVAFLKQTGGLGPMTDTRQLDPVK